MRSLVIVPFLYVIITFPHHPSLLSPNTVLQHLKLVLTVWQQECLFCFFIIDLESQSSHTSENPILPPLGFNWKKITEKTFTELSKEMRFILSNKSIYENYKKYGQDWVGDCETGGALALKYDNDTYTFDFLGEIKLKENGYVIVCIDKKTNKLYIPQKR